MRRALPIALVVGLVALVTWQVLDRSPQPGGAGPLDHAPADTPWLVALDEPWPEDVVASWERQMAGMTAMQVAQLDRLHATLLEEGKGGSLPARLLGAFTDEIRGKTTSEALAGFGLSMNRRFALYGVGLVPVFRIELADPAAFRAGVERLEGRVGEALPTGRIGEQDYWVLAPEDAPLRGVMAIVDEQLVLSVAPAEVGDELLGPLLGLDGPGRTSAIAAMNARRDRYGFVPGLVAYLDHGRLLSRLGGALSPLEQAFLDALDLEAPTFEPACTAEFAAIATTFPGMAMGYTQLSAESMDMVSVLETSEALATDLMTLRAPLPGADAVGVGTLFNLGVSLNLDAVPKLASRHAAALRAEPFACPQLAWINEAVDKAGPQLSGPAVYSAAPVFRGLHLVVDEVDFDGERPQPKRGALLLGSPNPQSLVALAKSMVPGLAELELPADGTPVPVVLPQLAALGADLETWAATGDGLLGLAFGPDASTRLPPLMAVDPERQPLLLAGYSGDLFVRIADIMDEVAAETPPGPEQDEARAAAELMREIYGSWVERLELELVFTEHGLEMRQRMTTR